MNRIDTTFRALRAARRAALIPFLTAGDPDMDTTRELLRAAVANGADLIEIGVPFSDPTADGPTLQKSLEIGLRSGASLGRVLELVADFRGESAVPIILYGYFNPIFHYGCERFAADAKQAGVDGLLVVDLPPEEADQLLRWTKKAGLHFVFLLAPTTGAERAQRILKRASGFVYYVSVTGVTGVRPIQVDEVRLAVERLRPMTRVPIGVRFGIASDKQTTAVAEFADAVIVDSTVIRLMDANHGNPQLVSEVGDFIRRLRGAIERVDKKEPALVAG